MSNKGIGDSSPTAAGERPVGAKANRLSTNPPSEQRVIGARCVHPTAKFFEFTESEIEQSIPSRFETIARMHPDRIAVKTSNRSFTYQELNRTANRIAQAIITHEQHGSKPVAILLDDSILMIATLLATLKAGKIYVPLDASHPIETNRFTIHDSGARLILTDTKHRDLCHELTSEARRVIAIDALGSSLSDESPGVVITPDAFAYIMYTSGSTGKPKGVIGTHRNTLYEVKCNTNKMHIGCEDKFTLLHSLSFSGAIYNLFTALLNGAAILPFDAKRESVPAMIHWLIDEELTIYHSIPARFRLVAESLSGTDSLPKLRVVILGGAPASMEDVNLFKRSFDPNCILLHRMGTTETNTVSWYFIDKSVDHWEEAVPLGWPESGKEILLLDEHHKSVAAEEVGEIAVRSRYLSPGYWNDRALTETKFLPDAKETGERIYLTGDLGRMTEEFGLLHQGRKDFQVKIRGILINPSAIEKALTAHPCVKEAVVIAASEGSGNHRLVAYYRGSNLSTPSVNELREFLRRTLPEHMIPSLMVALEEIPLTPNGKVDRHALPKPGNCRPDVDTSYTRPRTPIEETLADIWEDILAIDRVGIHDNFFELGGHSLAATRVVSQVLKRFQLDLPLQALFQSPTIAEMALVVTENRAKKLRGEELTQLLNKLDSLTDAEASVLLSKAREKRGV
jgi:amino acid adenylation domain-containing protein